jgi:hypothetical protein
MYNGARRFAASLGGGGERRPEAAGYDRWDRSSGLGMPQIRRG